MEEREDGEGGGEREGGEGEEEEGDAGCTGPCCSPASPLPFLPPPTPAASTQNLSKDDEKDTTGHNIRI